MPIIAAAQLNCNHSIKENFELIEHYTQIAAESGAQLIVLPEHCLGHYHNGSPLLIEELNNGPIQQQFSALAKQYKIGIVVGALPIKINHSIYSTLLVYNEKGDLCSYYSKIHLFDVNLDDSLSIKESDRFHHGNKIETIKTSVGCLGLSICYDLRFPELYRELTNRGAQILLVPSAFLAETGKAHWETLLRARAIENSCYVIAANQYGLLDNNLITHGHSMMINPWGEIIQIQKEGDGLLLADINLDEIDKTRQRLPANRRL